MRKRKPALKKYKSGDRRIVRRFLWFPKTLCIGYSNIPERRWLEYGEWIQIYTYRGRDYDWEEQHWFAAYRWKNIGWLEEDDWREYETDPA